MSNEKPSVFIGSSTESYEIAEAVEVNLQGEAEVTLWKDTFTPGTPILEDFQYKKDIFDFAIFIFNDDDIIITRNDICHTVRDNVVFELGLFIGALGYERVFVLYPNKKKLKIFSDYKGVTYLSFDIQRQDNNLISGVRPACTKIKAIIKKLGRTRNKSVVSNKLLGQAKPRLDLLGLEKIYTNYIEAEQDILKELKKSRGPIRLFLQIAAKTIGMKGSLFDVINEVSTKKNVELRVLHSSEQSPLFARDRLESLNKDPDRIIDILKYVNKSLEHLEGAKGSSLRHRVHTWPFIWRIYGFDDKLFLMPYYTDKDAIYYSPVLLFKKSSTSLYKAFVDFFDYVWEQSAPSKKKLSDIITPATPAGTALFLKWEGYHVFGIPRRDLKPNHDFIRFYGVGGKRKNSTEEWIECALREGNEETNNSIDKILNSDSTFFVRKDGIIDSITIIGEKIRPRLIIEKKKHTGLGSMKVNDDVYYLVAYNAALKQKPLPTNEVAALVFLTDYHLSLFKKKFDVTVGEIKSEGAIIISQPEIKIRNEKILIPHGTASFLIRKIKS